MMNLSSFVLVCLSSAALICGSNQKLGNSLSDRQIVTMGHKAWIQKNLRENGNSVELLEEAERRFSWAQTAANEKVIAGRSNSKDLQDLQLLIANITKSSYVIGDYMMLDKPYDHLYIAKSTSLSALALRNVLGNTPTIETNKQSDLLPLLNRTRKIHVNQPRLVEAFRIRKGGFSHQQLLQEYDRMASMMLQALKAKAVQTEHQRQHILHLCRRLIDLTLGKDPLPY